MMSVEAEISLHGSFCGCQVMSGPSQRDDCRVPKDSFGPSLGSWLDRYESNRREVAPGFAACWPEEVSVRAWAYGCKIEEQDPPTPTAQQRAPSCRGNRHRSLPPRSSCPALSAPTSCTRSRSCSGALAFVNQHGGPSIAKACRVIRSAGGYSSSGRTSSSSPRSRASLAEHLGEPPVSESFLSVPKLARTCPRLPKSAAHAELVGVCGAALGNLHGELHGNLHGQTSASVCFSPAKTLPRRRLCFPLHRAQVPPLTPHALPWPAR